MEKNIQNVLNNIDSKWSKDEVIRYVYIKIAPFFQKDLQYFMASSEEQLRQYRIGFIKKEREVVCSTLVDRYIEVYHMLGIRARKIISINTEVPLFCMIVEGEKGWYYLDPLNDLFYNQYGLMALNFGIVPRSNREMLLAKYDLRVLPKDYLKKLDRTLNMEYYNDFFDYLHKEIAVRNVVKKIWNVDSWSSLLQKKMEFSSDNLINLGEVKGPMERVRMHFYIMRMICERSEKRRGKIWLDSNNQENAKVNISFNGDDGLNYEEVKENGLYVLKRKNKE